MADKIKLYSAATPNGKKAGIALEEMELPYEPHFIDFSQKEQKSEWFVKINPNGRIPAIVDPYGPGGKEITVFETGAILLYLAEKSGKFYPPNLKWEIQSWIFLINTGLTPVLGNLGFFTTYWDKNLPVEPVAIKRFTEESERIFGIIEEQLNKNAYLVGDEYTIADINLYPWAAAAVARLPAEKYPKFNAYVAKIGERPAVQRGLLVNAKKQ